MTDAPGEYKPSPNPRSGRAFRCPRGRPRTHRPAGPACRPDTRPPGGSPSTHARAWGRKRTHPHPRILRRYARHQRPSHAEPRLLPSEPPPSPAESSGLLQHPSLSPCSLLGDRSTDWGEGTRPRLSFHPRPHLGVGRMLLGEGGKARPCSHAFLLHDGEGRVYTGGDVGELPLTEPLHVPLLIAQHDQAP